MNFTALHMAAAHGRYYTARALVAAGADVDARDVCDETPLRIAAYNGDPEVVRLLLCAGANAELANARGETPLSSALAEKEAQRSPLSNETMPLRTETVEALTVYARAAQGCGLDGGADRAQREAVGQRLFARHRVNASEALDWEVDMHYEPCDAVDEEAEKKEALEMYGKWKSAVARALKKVFRTPMPPEGKSVPGGQVGYLMQG